MSAREVLNVYSCSPRAETRCSIDRHQEYFGKVNLLSVIITKQAIMCCKYTENIKNIALGFSDGTIKLFDVNTGACTHSLVDDECRSFPAPVTSIKHRFSRETQQFSNTLLSSYINGCVKCWNYPSDQCIYTIREKRQALGMVYHPRLRKIVTFGDDCNLNMYNEETQTLERAFYKSATKRDGHTSRIYACAFHPQSSHEFVSGGWDDHVMCWDDRQPFATKHFKGVHMCGDGISFDKPGKEILTCSWREKNPIQLWDYASCKLIENIIPDNTQSKLYCGKLIPNLNLIVCGGTNCNMLRLIDSKSKMTLCSIRSIPQGIINLDIGHIRRKPVIPKLSHIAKEIRKTPRISFVSGKSVQTVDFG